MSEYQYYEFQALDRPLTREVQEAVASLSSRVQPHPRRAVFVYNYGDFRGNPEKVLTQYYDAMFYLANWGSRHLMFRFPTALVDVAELQQYSVATDDDPPSEDQSYTPPQIRWLTGPFGPSSMGNHKGRGFLARQDRTATR